MHVCTVQYRHAPGEEIWQQSGSTAEGLQPASTALRNTMPHRVWTFHVVGSVQCSIASMIAMASNPHGQTHFFPPFSDTTGSLSIPGPCLHPFFSQTLHQSASHRTLHAFRLIVRFPPHHHLDASPRPCSRGRHVAGCGRRETPSGTASVGRGVRRYGGTEEGRRADVHRIIVNMETYDQYCTVPYKHRTSTVQAP